MSKFFSKKWHWLLAALFALLIFQYLRPLPLVSPKLSLPQPPRAQPVDITWPASGQAALGAAGYGLLTVHGDQKPVPIGSTAKIFTALAVLKQKPLTPGSQGPDITITQADVDLYNSYYSNAGSSTKVELGEKISEYQALESLLLPSSNNIADTLANWAFGSKDNYLKYANQMVKNMSLNNTVIKDTNGFSDLTTSTASDMVKLGLVAINNPTLIEITAQKSADVPVAGTISNTNFLLGNDGIFGIKTGHTNAAGGNYIFAAKQTVQNHQITLVGAILNQPDLASAVNDTPSIINSGLAGFQQKLVIKKGQIFGTYKAPWGAKTQLVSPKDISMLVWQGAETKISGYGDTTGPAKAGKPEGQITISNLLQSQVIKPVLSKDLGSPSIFWRLIR